MEGKKILLIFTSIISQLCIISGSVLLTLNLGPLHQNTLISGVAFVVAGVIIRVGYEELCK